MSGGVTLGMVRGGGRPEEVGLLAPLSGEGEGNGEGEGSVLLIVE